jgi:cell division protein ZapA
MHADPVELRVGGQTYRVVASASQDELRRLAAIVDDRLRAITPPGRAVSPQSLLLAAIALAHELEEEKQKNQKLATRSREMLGSILTRIDAAMGSSRAAAEADAEEPAPSP